MAETHTRRDKTDLVRAAQAGDEDAFADLVRLEYRSLVAAATAILADHHEAEDAAVETFAAAWDGLGSLRDPDRFGPWLSRILTRTARRRRRRLARRPVAGDFAAAAEPTRGEDPRLDALLRAVRDLPEKYRVPLSLHHLREHSLREVARITGVPEKRVKSRLFEARKLLRRRLGDARNG